MALITTSVLDVDPNEFIERLAQALKQFEDMKPPKWAAFVKTGHFKQRTPVRADWWYVRAAAVLRSIYGLGPIGVQKLRTKYGGKKDRGHKSEHSYKGSGSIIRKILQQLERIGFINQTQKGVHKGRILTPKGKSFLAKVTKEIAREKKGGVEEKERVREEVKRVKEEIKPKGVELKKEVKREKKEKGEEVKKVEELAERFMEKGTLREMPAKKKEKKRKGVEDVDLSKERIEELAKELRKKGTLRK